MSNKTKPTKQTKKETLDLLCFKLENLVDDLNFHKIQADRLSQELLHHNHSITMCQEAILECEKKLNKLLKINNEQDNRN
jgi:hypothetical protein